MFITGIVTATDESSARVKLQVPDMDNFETGWFFVPQMCTVGDKSYNQVKTKTLVGACCSDDLQDGCIIGALYNDEDVCILGSESTKYIFFEDGTKIQYDKLNNELIADCVGNLKLKAKDMNFEAENVDFKAKKMTVKSEIEITGNAKQTGDLSIIGGITATNVIKSLTDVLANAISVLKHIHSKGQNGLPTGEPQ